MKKLSLLLIILFSLPFLYSQERKYSDEEYFVKYMEELDKTQVRLTYMNKKNAMSKMGTETIEGKISGTLFYTVKIKGVGAEILLRYTDFCEEEGWIFNGDILVHSNMNQDGTFSGTIAVNGTSPGKVYYDDVKMKKGMPSAGNYEIEQEGFPKGKVPYTVYVNLKK